MSYYRNLYGGFRPGKRTFFNDLFIGRIKKSITEIDEDRRISQHLLIRLNFRTQQASSQCSAVHNLHIPSKKSASESGLKNASNRKLRFLKFLKRL